MGGDDVRQFELRRTLFGADVTAQVTVLDEGVHVLLTGGERSHVGAAALAKDGALLACPAFPGHKEQVVCERWASVLSQATGCATVCCGIHYDNAKPEQIKAVLCACEELLQGTLVHIGRSME